MKTYNCEGVNPDGYFLDKLEPIPSALPSGLTPSQLYVFMPPNLGGFFMVRSYYPSECHADYFDFRSEERFSGMPRPISYAVFCLKKKRKMPLSTLINLSSCFLCTSLRN